jgi:hypothetical protein
MCASLQHEHFLVIGNILKQYYGKGVQELASLPNI